MVCKCRLTESVATIPIRFLEEFEIDSIFSANKERRGGAREEISIVLENDHEHED